MSDSGKRVFELTTTVTFPHLPLEHLDEFARKLEDAVRTVLSDNPAVTAYFVTPDRGTGDFMLGFRFDGADPRYIEEMAVDMLNEAVELVAAQDGSKPLRPEREESALVLA
ncbi:hypothetical protein [Plantibacter elymi (nom. nud.)]|uniref:hypothetical protein n=1 Tax=Plantibacter elymi (nom. nud.) TaxID=199708 RepID=UPI001055412F|nr:hypothetical protein [Plantibacter sp. VKM Ac-1784]